MNTTDKHKEVFEPRLCEFCAEHKGEKNVSVDRIDGTVTIFTEWIYGRLKICATDGGVTAFYQPTFCPECGRDLRKENTDDRD